MQDLIQNYVSDLHTLREVFHKELEATSEELSKAMALYAKRCDAALASFMEKASARDSELEASAAARLNQFCGLPGLPAKGGLTDVDKRPLRRLMRRGSPPPQSGRSQIVCMSRALGIPSRSRSAR